MFTYNWSFLGGLEMEGVYRVNGGQLTMKKLKTSFDQGKAIRCFWILFSGYFWSFFVFNVFDSLLSNEPKS